MKNKIKSSSKFVFIIVILVLMLCLALPLAFQFSDTENLYTQQDLEDKYNEGYNDAIKNDELLNSLKSQVDTLTQDNDTKQKQIESLESDKSSLQQQVDNLTQINADNEKTIKDNESTISSLEVQIKNLENSNDNFVEQILNLNGIISDLRNVNSELQTVIKNNIDTIDILQSQIKTLNSQISEMSALVQSNSSTIVDLNQRIDDLEKALAYYDDFISDIVFEGKVVARFDFDGVLYNIQIIDKNSTVTVTEPTSTEYVIFNYWTVNGEQVDLSTYQVSENTTFVANVTKKYDVKFMVDNAEYDSQIVVENGFATLPSAPSKAGYEFDGWSLDGVNIVDVSSKAITSNTTYLPVFTKLHTVTFMYENGVKETQQVRNGEYATDVDIEDTTYKVFNGWTLSGSLVDISSQRIWADTTFVAEITYYYDIVFSVDDEDIYTGILKQGSYVTEQVAPAKTGYDFLGWTINGTDIIDFSTYQVNSSVTFVAKYEIQTFTVTFTTSWIGGDTLGTKQVNYGDVIGELNFDIPTKEHYEFKYWETATLIPQQVDLSTYVVTSNVSFVPYYEQVEYVVSFYNSEVDLISTVIVPKDTPYVTIPEVSTPTLMRFVGWQNKNYNEVYTNEELSELVITSDRNYYAKYEYLYSGYFVTDDTRISPSRMKQFYIDENGNVTSSSRYYTTFAGYQSVNVQDADTISMNADFLSVNNAMYNYTEMIYSISNDCWRLSYTITIGDNTTSYVATFNREANTDGVILDEIYNVSFIVDDDIYMVEYIVKNSFAILPSDPIKSQYNFIGWSLDGVNIVNVTSNPVISDMVYKAVFEKIPYSSNGTFDNTLFTLIVTDDKPVKCYRNSNSSISTNQFIETSTGFYSFQLIDGSLKYDFTNLHFNDETGRWDYTMFFNNTTDNPIEGSFSLV